MDTTVLRNIGLTDSEIKVYLALLELGATTKGPIVDRAGVASSKIYELLAKLIAKGLVSCVIRSGVRYYESASATRVLDLIKERQEQLKEQEAKAHELVSRLELQRSMAGIGSETQVFKGMKGAATSFEDILRTMKKGEEYYVLGISSFTPHFGRFVQHFHKKRSSAGIKCKILVNELAKGIGQELKETKHTEVRYLRKELFTPVVFIIYRDKTLISIGLDEIFIQIKSKNLSDGMRTYAKYLWSIATKD